METYKERDKFIKAMQVNNRDQLFTLARSEGYGDITERTDLLKPEDPQWVLNHPDGYSVPLRPGWYYVLDEQDRHRGMNPKAFHDAYEDGKQVSAEEPASEPPLEKEATVFIWSGKTVPYTLKRFLGQAFIGVTEENVPGEVQDRILVEVHTDSGFDEKFSGPTVFKKVFSNKTGWGFAIKARSTEGVDNA